MRFKNVPPVAVIVALALFVAITALAQQVPLPKTPADVTAPGKGAIIHPEYAKAVGRMAYIWGWPMVNMINRRASVTQAPQPGFYLIIGPNWKGKTPKGINAMVRSSTELANIIPRVFMDNTAEDRKAIQPIIDQIVVYPLKEFDGKMKTIDWSTGSSDHNYGGSVGDWKNPLIAFYPLALM